MIFERWMHQGMMPDYVLDIREDKHFYHKPLMVEIATLFELNVNLVSLSKLFQLVQEVILNLLSIHVDHGFIISRVIDSNELDKLLWVRRLI